MSDDRPPILEIHGSLDRASENVVEDAIVDLTTGCEKLRRQFFGVKDYDRWRGQRSDHTYGMVPSHGDLVLTIGLTREARTRLSAGERLSFEEVAEAVFLLNRSATTSPMRTLGAPPAERIMVPNPAWATWVEKAAVGLCGREPPCPACQRLARRYAQVGSR